MQNDVDIFLYRLLIFSHYWILFSIHILSYHYIDIIFGDSMSILPIFRIIVLYFIIELVELLFWFAIIFCQALLEYLLCLKSAQPTPLSLLHTVKQRFTLHHQILLPFLFFQSCPHTPLHYFILIVIFPYFLGGFLGEFG